MNDLERRFLAIAQWIRHDVSAIRESQQQQEQTAHKQYQTAIERQDPSPDIGSVLNTLQGISEQYRTANHNEDNYQRRNLFVQRAGVIVLALYTTATFWQGCEMRRAAKAAEDAVTQAKADNAAAISTQEKIAKDSLAAAQHLAQQSLSADIDQFRLDQRAWMAVRGIGPAPEVGKVWNPEVVFTNTGKTPAVNMRISCLFDVSPENRFSKEQPYGIGSLVPPNDIYSCKLSGNRTGTVITQDALKALTSGSVTVHIHGSMVYEDIFGETHWLKFCRTMDPDGTVWGQCKYHKEQTGDGYRPPSER
jgi:hypothetical protein